MPYTESQVGYQETDTSRAAAELSEVELLRNQVYESIKQLPGTADEVAIRLNRDRLSIRPRCSELKKKLFLIQDSGERRANDSGKKAIVWRASTPEELEQFTVRFVCKKQGTLF
jgi:hypothetical protein